jgi:hypothetical protein
MQTETFSNALKAPTAVGSGDLLGSNVSSLAINRDEKALCRVRWFHQQTLESKLASYISVIVVQKDRCLDLRELPPEMLAFLRERKLAPSRLRIAYKRGKIAKLRQLLADCVISLINVGKRGHKSVALLPNVES